MTCSVCAARFRTSVKLFNTKMKNKMVFKGVGKCCRVTFVIVSIVIWWCYVPLINSLSVYFDPPLFAHYALFIPLHFYRDLPLRWLWSYHQICSPWLECNIRSISSLPPLPDTSTIRTRMKRLLLQDKLYGCVPFYPRPVLAFGYCCCLRLSVSVSIRPCVRASTLSLSARWFFYPSKPGSSNLEQRCKAPWLRSYLLWRMIDLDLKGQI